MSSISNEKSWHQQMCESVVSTGVSGVSMAGALVPTLYFFMGKSVEQTGKGTFPTFRGSLREWKKMAPVLSGTICLQLVGEKTIKQTIAPDFEKMDYKKKVAASTVSSFATGAMTSPLLAIFNAMTMKQAFTMPTGRQLSITTAREGFFIAGLTGSDPIAKWAREQFGGVDKRVNKGIEYTASAVTAIIASVLSHPCDTILSAAQAGRPVRHLMAGWKIRSTGVAGLVVFYKAINESLQPCISNRLDQLYSA